MNAYMHKLRRYIYSLFQSTLGHTVALGGFNRANWLTCSVAECILPRSHVKVGEGHVLQLCCPNPMAQWRASSFLSKEPATICWISEFATDDSLLDVGANVGTYSLFAAIRGHRVIAIEPESQNYALLNENIFVNKLDGRLEAYNLALSDSDGATRLFLSKFGAANALHTVGREVDFRHQPMKAAFRQGIMEMTLDTFLAGTGDFFPSHIKIDVDGAEKRIIEGASRTLMDPRLRSILIEINEELPADAAMVSRIQAAGFKTIVRESADMIPNPLNKVYNYVFRRC